ncbi:MAG TPA: LysM domain-containing protein [Tepidiformaceae bacterium]|nr:LysM domain-containing protein [Tepidiformaceae bacterium]
MAETTCHYCSRPAEAECPTCGRLYCAAHGDDVCLRCLSPESAAPSALVYRGSLLTLVIATLVTVFLIARPPEKEAANGAIRQVPTSTAAVSATATPTPPGVRTPAASPTGAATPATPAASPTGQQTPASSPTTQASPTPGAKVYTVKPGDTLSAIAAANGTTVDALIAANPGLNPDTLQVGAEIRLP